jgi:hypothetical protein
VQFGITVYFKKLSNLVWRVSKDDSLKMTMYIGQDLISCFDGGGVSTQDYILVKQELAKQGLDCLSHSFGLFCSGYFGDEVF